MKDNPLLVWAVFSPDGELPEPCMTESMANAKAAVSTEYARSFGRTEPPYYVLRIQITPAPVE